LPKFKEKTRIAGFLATVNRPFILYSVYLATRWVAYN